MIPLTLKVNAFLTYAGTQAFDFTQFEAGRMFLVYGPTGAGKTTIFDAITFALYGVASGSSRARENLKSDFAKPEEICWVELTFSLKGETYTVHREPQQEKLGRRGAMVDVKASAQLYLPDGTIITGVAAVNAHLEGLLGLTVEQFKKIVMLPQGEFKRLLEAPSKEKQEIFRKIFSTQVFEKVEELFAQLAKENRGKLAEQRTRLSTYLQGVEPGDDDALAEAMAAELPDYKQITSLLEAHMEKELEGCEALRCQAILKEKEREKLGLSVAKLQNEKLLKKEALAKSLEELKVRGPEMEAFAGRLERAKAAAKVWQVVTQQRKTKADEAKLAERAAQADQDLAGKKRALEAARPIYEGIAQLEGALEELRKKEQGLTRQLETCAEVKAKRDKLTKLVERQAAFQSSLQRLEVLETYLSFCEREKVLGQELGNVTALLAAEDAFAVCNRELEALEETYQREQGAFLQNQAGILAQGLKEGEKCPVCGSTHHPAKAQGPGTLVTEEQLALFQKQCEEKRRETQQKKEAVLRLEAALRPLLEVGESVASAAKKWREEAEGLAKRQKEAEVQVLSFTSLEAVASKGLDDPQILAERKKQAAESILEGKARIQAVEESLAKEKETLAEEEISAALLALLAQKKEKSAVIESARNNFYHCREELERAGAMVQSLAEQLASTREGLLRSTAEVRESLAASGFTDEAEVEAVLQPEEKLKAAEERLTAYSQKVALTTIQLEELEKETEGLTLVDIDALSERDRLLEAEGKALNEAYLARRVILERNQHQAEAIHTNMEVYQRLYENARQVDYLTRTITGSNEKSLSLESYILTTYLDEILEAANRRLDTMTVGRYQLSRSEKRAKFGRASGLDITVFDSHTGKERNVETLSGGESFKASLSMALGLADVVQRNAGGVEIKTMFIDEGFGTLDTESLDSAIQTLLNLQAETGLIGIISHVSELRERLHNKIEVIPGADGSKAKLTTL